MTAQGAPSGSVYDWFRRAGDLLASGNASACLVLIDRVLLEDPTSQAAREIRARALFDCGRFAEAADAFAEDGGGPGEPAAEGLGELAHRSLRESRPSRPQRSERIQKRATTFVAGQPFFWKW